MQATQQRPFGKYFLLQKLATGGMAEIFKAKTFGVDGFEKTVVIKKILPHWSSDPEFVRMLIDEAKLSVLLNHSNIVEVFDLGSFENDYYIAMEWVEGLDLRSLMNRVEEKGEKIPADVACFITLQVAAGLDYAHKKTGSDEKPLGIIHRDVSPHNILLSRTGEVKITDFGIAKATLKKSFTTTGVLKGKFSYMSPEQVRSEPLTPQSDVFSLGLVLYEMLLGKKCFDGDTELAIIDKVRHCDIHFEDFPSDLPESGRLKNILSKALAKDLADRYPTAEAMQVDLAQTLALIHPGFLPKDLAGFTQPYKPEVLSVDTTWSFNQPLPKEEAISQSAETNISYVPGFKTPQAKGVATKKSVWPWLLILFFLFLSSAALGAYLLYSKVLKPRLEAKMKPATPTAPALLPPVQNSTPPSTTTGSLEIRSTPPGVSIFIDEKDTGLKTPATVSSLPLYVGQSVSLRLPGYENWEKSVTLVNSNPLPLDATLSAKLEWGQAYVVSNPGGAEIFVDDRSTGLVTPATVDQLTLNQPHRIRLMKQGYLAVEAVYTPTTLQIQRIDLPLKEIPSSAVAQGQTPSTPTRALPRRPLRRSGEESGQPLRQVAPPTSPSGIIIGR